MNDNKLSESSAAASPLSDLKWRISWHFTKKKRDLADWLRGRASKLDPYEGNYIDHAKRELQALGYDLNQTEEDPNRWIQENLFELLEVFGRQGHSGSSAPYCANMFKKLALFEPLCPLTGEENEWHECYEEVEQNIRCSHVFRENGQAYDCRGRVFREDNGACFTSKDSRVNITFPYTPSTEYVDVDREGNEL